MYNLLNAEYTLSKLYHTISKEYYATYSVSPSPLLASEIDIMTGSSKNYNVYTIPLNFSHIFDDCCDAKSLQGCLSGIKFYCDNKSNDDEY